MAATVSIAKTTALALIERFDEASGGGAAGVLDAARVSAVGTHQELLEGSGLYRELATHQLLA